MVTVGIDPHKHVHVAVALNSDGTRLGRPLKLKNDATKLLRLLTWIRALADGQPLRWAIEGGPGLGRGLADALLLAGQSVVWVHPTAMAAHRRLRGATGAKSDVLDAEATARAALADPDLPHHRVDAPIRELRLLVDARADLVKRRTAAINQVKAHTHVWLEHTPGDLTTRTGPAALAALVERAAPSATVRRVLIDLIDEIAALNQRVRDYETLIGEQVTPLAPALLAIPGIGCVSAATLIGEIGDPTRFATATKLARYTGCAPIPVYSSDQKKHRLHRGGNRRLNSVIHQVAITQGRCHPDARAFLDAKTPTKGKRGAYRALKRHLVTVIHRAMLADHATWTHPTTTHQLAA